MGSEMIYRLQVYGMSLYNNAMYRCKPWVWTSATWAICYIPVKEVGYTSRFPVCKFCGPKMDDLWMKQIYFAESWGECRFDDKRFQ